MEVGFVFAHDVKVRLVRTTLKFQ